MQRKSSGPGSALRRRQTTIPRETSRSTFELRIRADERQGAPSFQVHLLRSPAGDALGEIEDIDGLIDAFEHSVLGLSPTGDTQRIDLESLGDALFAALLPGEVRQRWERCLEQVDERTSDHALRLVVKSDPTCRRTRELVRLPWELMRDPRRGAFLALSRRTTVVRQLAWDDGVVIDQPRSAPTLRILVVLASPEGVVPLDLSVERQKIEQAVAGRPDIDLRVLDNPTFGELTDRLRQESYHVLHYMGHGAFDEASGVGQLLLAGADGRVAPVTAERLAQVVLDVESLRLVVLNACDTGRMKRGAEQPFTDLAGALLRSGVPAVIAMQTPIPDADAIELSRVFYRHLAAGESADEALAEARVAVYAASESLGGSAGSGTWAVPALFVRRPELAIFRPAPATGEDGAPPRPHGWRRSAAVAACGLVCAAIVGLFFLPAPWAGVELDVEASRVTFTLAESQSLFDAFALTELAVPDLERIGYPDPDSGMTRWASPTSFATDRLGAFVTAAGPAGLSLDDTPLPAGTRVEVAHMAPASLRISLDFPSDETIEFRPELSASTGAGSRLHFLTGSQPPPPVASEGRVVVYPRSDRIDLDLTLAASGGSFHFPLDIEDLRFAEIEEQELPGGASRVRTVSTLGAGTVLLTPLGGGGATQLDIDRHEGLDFAALAGHLTDLAVGDDGLQVAFRGRAEAVFRPEPDGRRVDLMPTWSQTPWVLGLATAAGALTLVFAFLDRAQTLLAARPGAKPSLLEPADPL